VDILRVSSSAALSRRCLPKITAMFESVEIT